MTRVRFPESASTSRATVRSQAALVVSVMARLRAASGGRVCAGVVVLPWYCAKFFQRDVYVRDSVGRVTGVVDRVRRTPEGSYGVRDVAQCYGYDVHNRLERAWTVNAVSVDAEDACVTAPTAQGQWLVDATAFDASWEYELAGQVASSSQSWVGSGGVMSQVLEYVYDGGAPHAVTSTGVGQYEYDGAGRMIARDADGAGGVDGQVLVWDAMSNLVSMTSTAGVERYVYDASGQRVVRVAGTVATAYVGSTELTDADTAHAGTLTGMRYYTLGSTTVALRDASGFSYLIGDVQGSASVLIPAGATGDADPDTVVASRNAYTPYGVTRGDDNLVTDRGWLGQVEDATSGLTYLNARYYDPATARFISPDPLMDPANALTLDPYRYADNNPVVFTDPSGLAPSCSGLTGQAYKNCSGYATGTYNYMTGKTTAKKNEELAKSGKAGVNKTTPKKPTKSGGKVHKPKPTSTATTSMATAFGSAVVGSGGVSSLTTATGYAFDATQFACTRASIASANLNAARVHPAFANRSAVSASGRALGQYRSGAFWANWKTVGSTPWVRVGGGVTAGAGVAHGTYDAYDSSLDAGEAPEVARDRAVVEAQAGTSAVITGSLATMMITSSLTGAAAGSLAPGVGTAIGFLGGLIFGGVTYAIISSRGNSAINEHYYGVP